MRVSDSDLTRVAQTSSPDTIGRSRSRTHVIVVDAGALERRLAIIGDIDRHGVAPQAFGNRIGELALVFGNEDTHDDIREVTGDRYSSVEANSSRVGAALGQSATARDVHATGMLPECRTVASGWPLTGL